MFINTDSVNNNMSINPSDVKNVLTEAYDVVKTMHSVDPMMEFDNVITNEAVFDDYINSMCESMTPDLSAFMKQTAAPIREQMLLEATAFGRINPYQKMVFPTLRVYFPRLIAKEAVTMGTMDAPSIVKYFIKYVLKDRDGQVIGTLPNVAPAVGINIDSAAVQTLNYDGNVKVLAGLDATDGATVQRNVKIIAVTDVNGDETVIDVSVGIDGGIAAPVTLVDGTSDYIVGNLDFATGKLILAASQGNAKGFRISGSISSEMNTHNRSIEMITEKIEINSIDTELSTNWTIELEQDAKALLDIDIKSEMIAVLGAQIATEIDAGVINDLVNIAETQHAGAVDSFAVNPPVGYAFGQKSWHSNVVPVINKISNTIYNDTRIGQGNVMLINPLDATVLQSLDTYSSTGAVGGDGELISGAYEVGNVQNKWKILVSPLVPQGKAPIVMKSNNEKEAVYTLYYYQPLYIQPFPLGSIPSLTLKSRYAKNLIRPNGIGMLKFV